MKRVKMYRYIFWLLLPAGWSGCANFEKIGSDLSKGVSKEAKGIGANVADGIQSSLTNESTRANLQRLMDSIITTAGLSANKQVVAIRDSIMNERAKVWLDEMMESATGNATKARLAALRNELLGYGTRSRIAAIRNDLLGYETNYRVKQILNDAVVTLLNDSTNYRLASMRDNLLGSQTNNLVRAMVDTAMIGIAKGLRENVNPELQDNASFIKKYATQLLITLGVIAAIIIIIVWLNRRKYLKAVTLLTAQIQNIPDQRVYDDLTAKIKDSAIKMGVEPTLRKVLAENGLLGKDSRNKVVAKESLYPGRG